MELNEGRTGLGSWEHRVEHGYLGGCSSERQGPARLWLSL